ncbi:MAG: glutamate racemase [Candidatus Parcubacteria bacterium]|nr:glutamate racemase [Candidatus Parcubacteria bacterium]
MLKKNNQPIGVFDSGVGGLSVLIELKKKLPNEDFVFLADQKYVPYGEKTKEELIKLVYKITDYLIKNHNIKIMVVACNTATCNAIDEIRSKYSIPIVGTVPAVKLAAKQSKTGTVACIATPSTSKSDRLKNIIKDFCQNVEVINIGCKNLEDAVEEGELESMQVNKLLHKYLDKVKNSDTDYLVLGCTHYPFLKKPIRKILGSKIKLIDSGKAIARRTEWLLKNDSIKNTQKKKGNVIYFTTGDSKKFSKVASKLMKEDLETQNVKI